MDIAKIIKARIKLLYETAEDFSNECDIPLENTEKAICGDFERLSFDEVIRIYNALDLSLIFIPKCYPPPRNFLKIPFLSKTDTQYIYITSIKGKN